MLRESGNSPPNMQVKISKTGKKVGLDRFLVTRSFELGLIWPLSVVSYFTSSDFRNYECVGCVAAVKLFALMTGTVSGKLAKGSYFHCHAYLLICGFL